MNSQTKVSKNTIVVFDKEPRLSPYDFTMTTFEKCLPNYLDFRNEDFLGANLENLFVIIIIITVKIITNIKYQLRKAYRKIMSVFICRISKN